MHLFDLGNCPQLDYEQCDHGNQALIMLTKSVNVLTHFSYCYRLSPDKLGKTFWCFLLLLVLVISPDVNSLKSVKAKEAFYKCLAFALHMYVSLYVNIIMGTVFRIAICMNKNVVTLCLTDAEKVRWTGADSGSHTVILIVIMILVTLADLFTPMVSP